MLRLITQPSSFAGAAAILTAIGNASQTAPHDVPSWIAYIGTLLCGAAAILRDGAAPAGASVPPAR